MLFSFALIELPINLGRASYPVKLYEVYFKIGKKTMKKETIEKLKEEFEGKEIIDDDTFEDIKKKRLKIGTESIIFAELIIFCYSNIKANTNEPKIKNKEVLKELKNYLEKMDIEKIRKVYSNFGGGAEIGDYYKKISIEREIGKDREKYEDLINNFFSIFEEEA